MPESPYLEIACKVYVQQGAVLAVDIGGNAATCKLQLVGAVGGSRIRADMEREYGGSSTEPRNLRIAMPTA